MKAAPDRPEAAKVHFRPASEALQAQAEQLFAALRAEHPEVAAEPRALALAVTYLVATKAARDAKIDGIDHLRVYAKALSMTMLELGITTDTFPLAGVSFGSLLWDEFQHVAALRATEAALQKAGAR